MKNDVTEAVRLDLAARDRADQAHQRRAAYTERLDNAVTLADVEYTITLQLRRIKPEAGVALLQRIMNEWQS